MKGQYLSEILNPLPTNIFLDKTLTNLGLTHAEIYCLRNSIIVEPNRPVILRKEEKHREAQKKNPELENILGVYQKTTDSDIMEYIKSDIKHKKIITTPEGFRRVKSAMLNAELNMYKDYFLLFDECERTIQDVRYRGTITAPIDDFFLFKNKAFVSATPLKYSDPRFGVQNFKRIKVLPDYEYQRDIEVIHTNNVVTQLKHYIMDNATDHYCFFVNSTATIHAIIKNLGIEKECLVHCAEDSVEKLKGYGFNSATEKFNNDSLLKYNFFTCRFFSGLDIELKYMPHVVILTDIYFASHSIIDPETEAIQIIGRFRNGVEKVTHITNIDPNFPSLGEVEAINYLKGCEKVYRDFIGLAASATNPGEKDTLIQALKRVEFANYISEGKINHFMCDNFYEEERVKSYYNNINNLISAYNALPHFKVELKTNLYPLGDIERLKRTQIQGKKESYIEIANQLESLYADRPLYTIDNSEAIKEELRRVCPLIVNAYEKMGIAGLREANFNEFEIKRALDILVMLTPVMHHTDPTWGFGLS